MTLKAKLENKKIVLGLMTMGLVLAIIVVSSFWPFILDPSKVGTAEFITDQLIITAITIFATISMMFVSQASNAMDERSEIAKAKVEFKKSIEKLTDRTGFYQWVKKVLQPADRKDIAETGMMRIGLPSKYLNLTDSEIRSLTVAQKIGEEYYKPLTNAEIKRVIALKNHINKVRFVSPNYYTSSASWMTSKNLSQIAANESAKKISTVVFQLFLKIFITTVGAAIFASLVRDLTQEGGSTAQAWIRFLSRMFAFVTSSFLGYLMGAKLNDMDAFYILKRVEVHGLYLEDKDFVPVDEDKEAFKERVLIESVKSIPYNKDEKQ